MFNLITICLIKLILIQLKMKLGRKKAAKRFLGIYKNHFGYTEPYKVLLDGTFVKNALDNKVQIFDQIKNYLGANVVLLTTEWYVLTYR